VTNSELALRIALIALIREVEKICDAGNKVPERNEAYRNAVKLIEKKDEPA